MPMLSYPVSVYVPISDLNLIDQTPVITDRQTRKRIKLPGAPVVLVGTTCCVEGLLLDEAGGVGYVEFTSGERHWVAFQTRPKICESA